MRVPVGMRTVVVSGGASWANDSPRPRRLAAAANDAEARKSRRLWSVRMTVHPLVTFWRRGNIAGRSPAYSSCQAQQSSPSLSTRISPMRHGGGSPFRPELGKTSYRQPINQATATAERPGKYLLQSLGPVGY